MSTAFTILCTRSPKNVLRRRGKAVGWKRGKGQLGGLVLSQRELEEGDDIPDDDWNDKVVAVIVADGTLDEGDVHQWTQWSEELAEATRGAIFDVAREEYSFVWADDPRPFWTAWTRRRLAASEIDQIVARMNREESGRRSEYYELEAIRETGIAALRLVPALDGVLPAERATSTKTGKRDAAPALVAPSDPAHIEALVNALFDHNELDTRLEQLVLAIATWPTATGAVRVRANLIEDRRVRELDSRARPPATTAELRALYEGVAAGDASCVRRHDRFRYEYAAELREVVVAAVVAGWSPNGAVGELVTDALYMPRLTDRERTQLEQLGDHGALARSLRDTAKLWRENAGKRAWDYAQAKFKDYERYRNDPLVVTPRRDRGMDTALYRPLNDALYGYERSRPRLPEAIIVMICDRRFDEAREAYAAELGAEHADAAIKDAIDYFAPNLP